jgi:hypothetical protein
VAYQEADHYTGAPCAPCPSMNWNTIYIFVYILVFDIACFDISKFLFDFLGLC